MTITIQICGGAIICSLLTIMGIMFTWPSSTVTNFKSNETVLSHVMEPYEVALLGSLLSVGALIGTPIFGYLLDKIGRKRSCVIAGVPFLLAWSLIAAFNQVEVLLVAIFIAGIGASTAFITPVYATEICQDSFRGIMTFGTVLFYNLGVLLSYVLGGYLSYCVMVYVQLTLSVLYIVLVSLLKDSPIYLMSKGQEEEAGKSIAFYRNVKPDSKEVLEELSNITRILNPEPVGGPEEEKLKPTSIEGQRLDKISPLKHLLKSQSSRRALAVCLVMVTAANMMGMNGVMVFAEPLFREAVPNLPPTTCTVILALVTIVAALTASSLANKTGRKTLMMYSAGGSAAVTLLLGTQLQLEWGPHVLTAILIQAFCFIYNIGAGIIPFTLFCEIFVPEVKSLCSMLIMQWSWLCSFLLLLMFNYLVETLGLGGLFYTFSGICLSTVLFCYFFQPETRGLPVDVIQTLFMTKGKKINVRV